MTTLTLLLLTLVGAITLAFRGSPIKTASIFLAGMTLITLIMPAHWLLTLLLIVTTLATLVFSIPEVRMKLVSYR